MLSRIVYSFIVVCASARVPCQDGGTATEADVVRWAEARAQLCDDVTIHYASWSCTAEGLLRSQSVRLQRWSRAPEGESLAIWRLAQADVGRIFADRGGNPGLWSELDCDQAVDALESIAAEEPHGYKCYQHGRFANWTRDSVGRWSGELLPAGDVFEIRDQLHMALGQSYSGNWLVPLDERGATSRKDAGAVLITGRDRDRVLLTFDDRNGLRSLDFFHGETSPDPVARLVLREATIDFGVLAPRWVSVIPSEPGAHLPMHFFVAAYTRCAGLPTTMLERPPVAADAVIDVRTVIDRVREARSPREDGSGNRLRESLIEANSESRKTTWPLSILAGLVITVLLVMALRCRGNGAGRPA